MHTVQIHSFLSVCFNKGSFFQYLASMQYDSCVCKHYTANELNEREVSFYTSNKMLSPLGVCIEHISHWNIDPFAEEKPSVSSEWVTKILIHLPLTGLLAIEYVAKWVRVSGGELHVNIVEKLVWELSLLVIAKAAVSDRSVKGVGSECAKYVSLCQYIYAIIDAITPAIFYQWVISIIPSKQHSYKCIQLTYHSSFILCNNNNLNCIIRLNQ